MTKRVLFQCTSCVCSQTLMQVQEKRAGFGNTLMMWAATRPVSLFLATHCTFYPQASSKITEAPCVVGTFREVETATACVELALEASDGRRKLLASFVDPRSSDLTSASATLARLRACAR